MPKKKKKTKITKLPRKKGLYLKDAGPKGRGVFCTDDIRSGEIIEVTPALILNDGDTEAVSGKLLNQYTFKIGAIPKRMQAAAGIKDLAEASAVVMGVMAYCNHDRKPNAEILWEAVDGALYYYLEATSRIAKGTEICTTYGNSWFSERAEKPH